MFTISSIEEGGITAYKQILSEKRQIGLLYNSLILAFGTSIFSIFIGVPLAFLIKRTDLYFKKYFSCLYLAPILIPPYINAISWIDLLGKQGRLNLFFMKIFSSTEPLVNIYSLAGAIFVLTLSSASAKIIYVL